MKYYKAKKDTYDYFNKYAVIENELLTEKERNTKARYIKDDLFEIVEINKNKTFFSFGVRFECKA